MEAMNQRGWLVQLEMEDEGIDFYFKTDKGFIFSVREEFLPSLFLVPKEDREIKYLARKASFHPEVKKVVLAEKRFSRSENKEVLKVTPRSFEVIQSLRKDLEGIPELKEVTNFSFPHYVDLLEKKGISFFDKCEIDQRGSHLNLRSLESDEFPSLKVLSLIFHFESSERDLKSVFMSGSSGTREVKISSPSDFKKLVEEVEKDDPDVVVTYNGDESFRIIANRFYLTEESLRLGRDGEKIKFREDGVYIPGRIHIDLLRDLSTDIYSEETGDFSLEAISSNFLGKIPGTKEEEAEFLREIGEERYLALAQLSRTCSIKPDKALRLTPGQINTYLHYKVANKRNYVIPEEKRSMENPKTLRELHKMDKGGLIFYPEPGIYEDVCKCDFSSMYPNIIVNNNISSETINCDCCSDPIKVPDASWSFCSKEKGIIAQGIQKVLEKRNELKKRMKKAQGREKDVLDRRQRTLKTILVTCFGYLGFSNFVFSRVECKESVMAFGREILRKSKLIAEKRDLKVIYGIVDSLFVRGEVSEFSNYLEEVTEKLGIELENDGIFDKIVFPPQDPEKKHGVANKYFGILEDGELEGRGVVFRQSQAPKAIKEVQKEIIRSFMENYSVKETVRVSRRLLDKIKFNSSERENFTFLTRLRKPLDSYKREPPHVKAAKRSEREFSPGSFVKYVYTEKGPVVLEESYGEPLKMNKYEEWFVKALSEVLSVKSVSEKEASKRLKGEKISEQKDLKNYLF